MSGELLAAPDKCTQSPIRILMADDHTIVRDGISYILSTEPDFEVVGGASNGLEALELARRLRPDVILIDLQMPQLNGVQAIRQLLAEDPQLKIIILTTFDTDEFIFEGIKAGARGYFLKDVPKEELCKAIRLVFQGYSPVQLSLTSRLFELVAHPIPAPPEVSLTEREMEILKLLARGKRNKEIANILAVSEHTIKGHVATIFQKLNVDDRTAAATYAIQKGLIKME